MTDFPDVDYAVDKLTDEWVSPAGQHSVYLPALLDMLQDAVTRTLTSGSGASHGAGLPVSSRAFQLMSQIRGWTRDWLSGSMSGDLKSDVRQMWQDRTALYSQHDILEVEINATCSEIIRWADSIWELYDMPRKSEIDGVCPQCQAVIAINQDGERSHALQAWWRDGEPYAECSVCGQSWCGEAQVMRLAVNVGATIDLAGVDNARHAMQESA